MQQGQISTFLKRKAISDTADNIEQTEGKRKRPPQPITPSHDDIDSIDSCKRERVNDISLFIDRKLSDKEKEQVLTSIWIPPKNYRFPLLEKFKKRKLKFRYQWLEEYNWLAYSEVLQGAFCKLCVVFANTGGIGSQPLGQLVKTKFDNWKKAKEVFVQHANAKYHMDCVIDAEEFLRIIKSGQSSIIDRIDQDRADKIRKNRKNLAPIVEAVIFCGRQEIALRGHRDSGKIDVDSSTENEGNFRELLKYRAKGDFALRSFLEGPGERNKYVSPTIQNEIIDCCNQTLLKKLTSRVNSALCFSILVDETSDISCVEQIAVCVRYVDPSNNLLREDFLQFFKADAMTGRGIADTILNGLRLIGVDCTNLVGQGYDGAANMGGKFNGVQAIIRKEYPRALYVHCAAHSLNLALSKASEIQPIRNCLGIIGKIFDFFNTPKRKAVVDDVIAQSNITPSAKSLKRLCATRWTSRYEAIDDFFELFQQVIEALEIICNWPNSASNSTDAQILLNSMDFDFIVSLLTIYKIFGYGSPLCRQLQRENLDLMEAVSLAEDVVNELTELRQDSENVFNEIFEKAKDIAASSDVEVKMKRKSKKQANRSNHETDTPEDFYRITVFNPYVDYFTSQLNERFVQHKTVFSGFSCLFTPEIKDTDEESFKNLVEFYAEMLEPNVFPELKLWQRKLEKLNIQPVSAVDTLKLCNPEIYPNVHKLIKILCTLPVSTATPERTFSALKRVKTYLRNCISEKRLNGLALLSIHRDIPISADEVIDELSKKPRCLDFVL